MKALIVALPFLILMATIYGAGVLVGQRKGGLNRQDRKELQASRELIDSLAEKAGEGAMLGDNSAVIALDMIRTHRRSNRK